MVAGIPARRAEGRGSISRRRIFSWSELLKQLKQFELFDVREKSLL
jgi:hypothetical protein